MRVLRHGDDCPAYVLEGSLRRAADRIRITARLVETRTGHSLWADRYDREMEDVFAIQDEIAQSIASALRCMLTEEEKQAIEKVPTADVRAYDVFLRGRQAFHQFRRTGFQEAEGHFRQAIEMDPNYARAFAGVAYCHAFLHEWWESSEANRKEADEASRKALELDPDLADAHAARGLALSILKRYDEAQAAFDKAIYLDPDLFEAYYFNGRVCFTQGNLADAAQLYEKSSQVRPEDYQALLLLNSVYIGLGRNDEGLEAARRGLAIAEKHLETRPTDARALYLGAIAYCQIGERERSEEWARRALAIDANEPSILYNVGCCFSLLGKIDESLTCLENAVRHGFNQREWLENDSDLNPLRTHPRFRALLKKMVK